MKIDKEKMLIAMTTCAVVGEDPVDCTEVGLTVNLVMKLLKLNGKVVIAEAENKQGIRVSFVIQVVPHDENIIHASEFLNGKLENIPA